MATSVCWLDDNRGDRSNGSLMMASDWEKDLERQIEKATAHPKQEIHVPTDGTEDEAVASVITTGEPTAGSAPASNTSNTASMPPQRGHQPQPPNHRPTVEPQTPKSHYPAGAGRRPREALCVPTPNPIEPMVGPQSVILTSGGHHRRQRHLLSLRFGVHR